MDVIGRLMMRPPILQLTFQAFLCYIMGPLLFKDKCFIAFLGDPWAKHMEHLHKAFIFYPTPNLLGLYPLLPIE
jgi:hypothetical protein